MLIRTSTIAARTVGACTRHCRGSLAALLAVVLAPAQLLADADTEPAAGANFGGPDAVPNLVEIDRTQPLDNWDSWKSNLSSEHGVDLGLDYTFLYLNADETVPGGQRDSAAGMLRFFGSWTLAGLESGNTGSFVWKFEHRHGYTDIAPSPLWAATELGYIGLQGAPFSDQGTRTTNFYWRQKLNDSNTTLVAGFIDTTDFLDLYGMVSPWLHFTNFALGTGSATMDVPNDATFGAAFGTMLSDKLYLVGSLVDANSDPTAFWESAETFFSDNEYFTSIELGLTSEKGRIYLDNTHLTLWHKDRREEAGKPSGWGANFSYAKFVDDRWMPFIRAGYSDDGDSLLSRSLSAGLGYRLRDNKDLFGAGFNWGEPNKNQGAGDDAQSAMELFYRLDLGKRFRFTADLQYIRDPVANPFESSIWVVGARGQFSL